MPLLKIQTNQAIDSTQQTALLKRLSVAVATMLGKPERYVMVILEHNPAMLFAGDASLLAYLELKSIGLPGERTQEFSRTLCNLVGETLGIATDRIYIEFAGAERHLWGWNGGTF